MTQSFNKKSFIYSNIYSKIFCIFPNCSFQNLSLISIIISSISITSLVGCMVGPDFNCPASPDTETYSDKDPIKTVKSKGKRGKAQTFVKGLDIPERWWQLFHSPSLNYLIETGLRNSPNLKAARATLCQASENLNVGIGALFPTFSATAGAVRQRTTGASFGDSTGGSTQTLNLFNASVNVNYPLDIWGSTRRQIESLSALVDYQYFQYEATALTLAANIATAAITEASLRAQIEATHELIQLNQQQLDILNKQFNLGGISRESILTQEAQIAILQGTLPSLEKSLSQTRHALSVLVGELPNENCLPKFTLNSLKLPATLPISCPSQLVEQRPDIKAATALMHQASAQIGVATANMLPQVTITGSYGYLSTSLSNLFSPANLVWNIGAQATQTLFAGGSLIAKKRANEAAFEATYEKYKQTVLIAFQNVADSLSALDWDAKFLKAQTNAEAAAKANLNLSQQQYNLGGINFIQLLTANQQYIQTRITRIQAEALRYSDTVALFQSLGGGWWKTNLLETLDSEIECADICPSTAISDVK